MTEYIEMRERFNPRKIGFKVEIAFVAESPPDGGNFFYDVNTTAKSALFKNLTEALKIDGGDKRGKLIKFQRRGFILLDATYTPINRLSGKARKRAIKEGLPRLLDEIRELRPLGVIVIKAPLFQIVKDALTEAGLAALLMHDTPILFPMYGHEKRFKATIKRLM